MSLGTAFRDGPAQLLGRQADGQERGAFLGTESPRPEETHLQFDQGLAGDEKDLLGA